MAIYVKNKDLRNELIFCRDSSLTHTPELLRMFTLMSQKLSLKFTYKHADDRKDCIQGGIIDAWQYWKSYDPSISENAFSYITQILKNGASKQFRSLYPRSQKGAIHVSLSQGKIHSL